ncbi:hypothetical protein ACLOJK_000925 [Asimina triloba]
MVIREFDWDGSTRTETINGDGISFSRPQNAVMPVEAVRPLDGESEWRAMKGYGRELVLEMSLPKGNPKRSEPSGCTNVPGKGGRPCSIN